MPVQELKLTVEPKTKTETNPSAWKNQTKNSKSSRVKEKRKTQRASCEREREKGGGVNANIKFALQVTDSSGFQKRFEMIKYESYMSYIVFCCGLDFLVLIFSVCACCFFSVHF